MKTARPSAGSCWRSTRTSPPIPKPFTDIEDGPDDTDAKISLLDVKESVDSANVNLPYSLHAHCRPLVDVQHSDRGPTPPR